MDTTEQAIEDLNEAVSEVADDIARWSREESVDIYRAVERHARAMADAIEAEAKNG